MTVSTHAPSAHRRGRGVVARADGRSRAVLPLVTGAAALAGAALLSVRSPHVGGSYGICPSLAVLGVWCPGCGGLRAVHELTGGDVAAAFELNPLAVLALPVVAGLWLLWLLGSLGLRRPPTISPRLGWPILVVLLGYAVARNVPALTPWLAPGGALPPALGG